MGKDVTLFIVEAYTQGFNLSFMDVHDVKI
jgi:hypothetical protein